MAEPTPNGVIYTTKELLTRIDEKIDRIEEKLDSKASRDDVIDLQRRVGGIELHGSQQAISAGKKAHELQGTLAGVVKVIDRNTQRLDQLEQQQEEREAKLDRLNTNVTRVLIGVALAIFAFALQVLSATGKLP